MAVILVADDDPKIRRIVSRMLRPLGHEVLEANNGIEALRLLALHKPRLVITDLLMPDMDGIETIQAIRRAIPDIKIVAMSGGGGAPDGLYLDTAAKFGADATLQKPFNMDELRATVRQLLA